MTQCGIQKQLNSQIKMAVALFCTQLCRQLDLCINIYQSVRRPIAKPSIRQFVGDEDYMNTTRLIAIVLIVAGILGLIYGGFSYTKDTTAVKLGPMELSVKEKKQVNVPMWAGIGAIVIGGLLLVLGNKKG